MKEKIIITSGKTFIDIDAAACAVALFEVESFLGNNYKIWLSKNEASSIISKYSNLLKKYNYQEIRKESELILVDVSDKNYLQNICKYNLKNVIEVFDHHIGSEEFWQKKLGSKSRIEKIGAAATLIYEYAEEKNALKALNSEVLEILAAAMVHNTQDFQTEFSCARDERVFKEISKKIFKNKEEVEKWKENYFLEIDKFSFKEPLQSLENDFKPDIKISFKNKEKTMAIAQLELFESKKFLGENISDIEKVLESVGVDYKFFMSASIKDSGTYFYTRDKESQRLLENILKIEFKKNKAFCSKIILRKEVLDKMVKIKCFIKKKN